jgi:hypothetical protein
MSIDTEIDDGNQELAFGADDTGVVVFDTESSDGDHEGIRIETPAGARELARLLLLWADSIDARGTPAPREIGLGPFDGGTEC